MIKKKLLKRCVALSMALVLAVGAGSAGIIDSIATGGSGDAKLLEAVEDAQDALTVANEALKAAQDALTAANEAVKGPQATYDAAVAALNTANTEKATADGEVTRLGNELATAQAAVTTAQNAQLTVDEADEVAVQTAATAVTEAQNAATALSTQLEAAKATASTAGANVTTAVANEATAKSALEQAISAATTAANTVTEKTNAAAAAQTALTAAQDAYNNSVEPEDQIVAKEVSVDTRTEYATQKYEGVTNQVDNNTSSIEVTATQTAEFVENTSGLYNVTLDVNAAQTTKTEKGSETVIVIDESTSVSGVALESMKAAATAIIANMDENDSVAILHVADEVEGTKNASKKVVFAGVNDKDALIKYVTEGIESANRTETTNTDMNKALVEANNAFTGADVSKNIVVLTDGGYSQVEDETVKALNDNGINCFAIGYGAGLDVNGNVLTSLNYFGGDDAQMAESLKSAMSETAVTEVINAIDAKSMVVTEATPVAVTAESIKATLTEKFEYVGETDENATAPVITNFAETGKSSVNYGAQEIPATGWSKTFQAGLLDTNATGLIDVIDATASGVYGVNGMDVAFVTSPVAVEVSEIASLSLQNRAVETEKITYSEDDIAFTKTSTTKDINSYNKREYDITLTAESLIEKERENPASIIVVFDQSGSMSGEDTTTSKKDTIYDTAHTALEGFTEELATAEKDADSKSQIAIIGFHNTADEIQGFTELTTTYDLPEEKMKPYGTNGSGNHTNLSAGLEAAEKLILEDTELKYPQNIHVVVFSDGKPTAYVNEKGTIVKSYNDANAATYAANAASDLSMMSAGASYNVNMYAVGYFTSGDGKSKVPMYDENGEEFKITTNEFFETYVAPGYTYEGTKASALGDIFSQISKLIMESTTVDAEKIVDQISEEFTMTAEQMDEVVKQFYASMGGEYSNAAKATEVGGTWEVNGGKLEIVVKDGLVDIIWSGKAAVLPNREKSEEVWEYIIPVTAKEDFLGGNLVETNREESGITITTENGSDLVEFQKPLVNVKTNEIAITDENTVFVGDNMGVQTFVTDKVIGDSRISFIDALVDDDDDDDDESNYIWNEDAKEYQYIVDGVVYGTIEVTSIKKVTTINGKINTETIKAVDDGYDIQALYEEIANKEADESKSVEYKFEFTYTPKTVEVRTDDSKVDENPDMYVDDKFKTDAAYSASTYAVTADYLVNILAGSIDINKVVTSLLNTDQAGDGIFQFTIERLDDPSTTNVDETTVWKREVRIDKNDGLEEAATILQNLPRGTYNITEESALRYDLQGVALVNTTATESVKESSEITDGIQIVVGMDEDAEGNLNIYKDADVEFTNKPDTRNSQTDTDMVRNAYVWTDNGLVVKQETLEDGDVVSSSVVTLPRAEAN